MRDIVRDERPEPILDKLPYVLRDVILLRCRAIRVERDYHLLFREGKRGLFLDKVANRAGIQFKYHAHGILRLGDENIGDGRNLDVQPSRKIRKLVFLDGRQVEHGKNLRARLLAEFPYVIGKDARVSFRHGFRLEQIDLVAAAEPDRNVDKARAVLVEPDGPDLMAHAAGIVRAMEAYRVTRIGVVVSAGKVRERNPVILGGRIWTGRLRRALLRLICSLLEAVYLPEVNSRSARLIRVEYEGAGFFDALLVRLEIVPVGGLRAREIR